MYKILKKLQLVEEGGCASKTSELHHFSLPSSWWLSLQIFGVNNLLITRRLSDAIFNIFADKFQDDRLIDWENLLNRTVCG